MILEGGSDTAPKSIDNSNATGPDMPPIANQESPIRLKGKPKHKPRKPNRRKYTSVDEASKKSEKPHPEYKNAYNPPRKPYLSDNQPPGSMFSNKSHLGRKAPISSRNPSRTQRRRSRDKRASLSGAPRNNGARDYSRDNIVRRKARGRNT